MSDVHLDTAIRLITEGRAPSEGISAYAQISIAISLQRIAEALEREPRFFAGIWDNKPPENPDFEYSADKWRDGLPTRPGYYWHRDIDPGCGEAYEWVVLLVQRHPEDRERLVVVPAPAPIGGEWGPRIPDPEEVREMAEEAVSPMGDTKRYWLTDPVHPEMIVRWFLEIHHYWFDEQLGANAFTGKIEEAQKYLAVWVKTGEFAPDKTMLEIQLCSKLSEWLASSWLPYDPAQHLSNLCDRHKRRSLPAPTTSTCARCAEEQAKSGWCEAHHQAPPCTRCSDNAAVSQPATFDSLAPTPLMEDKPNWQQGECWCGFGPSEPVHDPKYGSHVFGEHPDSKCPVLKTRVRHKDSGVEGTVVVVQGMSFFLSNPLFPGPHGWDGQWEIVK